MGIWNSACFPVKLEQNAPSLSSNAIKLKSHAMLATKSDITVSTNVDVSFHTLVCRQVLFSLEDITTPLPHAITNLLQEFKDVFPTEILSYPIFMPKLSTHRMHDQGSIVPHIRLKVLTDNQMP
jgi:hypothetical protein